MTSLHAYPWVALGVALSIFIPVVVRAVAQAFPKTDPGVELAASGESKSSALWDFAKPYVLAAILSLLVAVLIVALVTFEDARAAVIGGYAWDATVQKVRASFSK